ncbi:Phosphorelay intermediate protein [Rhizina undulata]
MPAADVIVVRDNASVEDRVYLPTPESEEGSLLPSYFRDIIDSPTFEQILEMDDDEEERDFSRAIVFGFFEQAETTFGQMESMIESKDLAQLSSLGHFLKGSSATLGLSKVKDSCEKIQHFGAKKDETGTIDVPDEETCLKRINETLKSMKSEYKEVELVLKKFYDGPTPTGSSNGTATSA